MRIEGPTSTTPDLLRRANSGGFEAFQVVAHEHEQVKERIAKSVEPMLNRLSQRARAAAHTTLNFSVDKETRRVVVRIMNSETKELILQIPNEAVLNVAAEINRTLGTRIDRLV